MRTVSNLIKENSKFLELAEDLLASTSPKELVNNPDKNKLSELMDAYGLPTSVESQHDFINYYIHYYNAHSPNPVTTPTSDSGTTVSGGRRRKSRKSRRYSRK